MQAEVKVTDAGKTQHQVWRLGGVVPAGPWLVARRIPLDAIARHLRSQPGVL
jgi:hypothetical protein